MEIKTLHYNEWLSLRCLKAPEAGVDGYVYSHETRCDGRIIAVLPFRFPRLAEGSYEVEYGLRKEVTPCWGFFPIVSALTGGYEGGNLRQTAIKELWEEAGIEASETELIELGTSFASKSSDTLYHLYAVNATDKEIKVAPGDGSRLETEAEMVWTSKPRSLDPQVSVMLLRLWELWYDDFYPEGSTSE